MGGYRGLGGFAPKKGGGEAASGGGGGPPPIPRAPGGWPQVGFNKHRRLMSRYKLPRDPRSGLVRGAMVASWAWIGWGALQDEAHQLWHAEAVKNTTVEYYWLDAGWLASTLNVDHDCWIAHVGLARTHSSRARDIYIYIYIL